MIELQFLGLTLATAARTVLGVDTERAARARVLDRGGRVAGSHRRDAKRKPEREWLLVLVSARSKCDQLGRVRGLCWLGLPMGRYGNARWDCNARRYGSTFDSPSGAGAFRPAFPHLLLFERQLVLVGH